jgi:hypothetical protein
VWFAGRADEVIKIALKRRQRGNDGRLDHRERQSGNGERRDQEVRAWLGGLRGRGQRSDLDPPEPVGDAAADLVRVVLLHEVDARLNVDRLGVRDVLLHQSGDGRRDKRARLAVE